MALVLPLERRLDLLQNSHEVEKLQEQTLTSKACTKSYMDHGLISLSMDLDYGPWLDQDCDDDAASAVTTASFLSDRFCPSEMSQRSDLSSLSESSSIPSTDGSTEGKVEHEEGAASPIDWSPTRQSRHRRTRSGYWNSDVAGELSPATPTQLDSEETGAASPPSAAGKSGQSSMQAAYFSFWPSSLRRSTSRLGSPTSLPPLAEVEAIEEEDDEDEVPTEPAPMVPQSFCSQASKDLQ